MAAGDMAQFVREHALHFLRVVCRADQAGMNIDRLSARHEGVDRGIIEQDEIDRARIETRRRHDRCGHVLKESLGLGITQHRLRSGRRRCDQQRQANGKRGRQRVADAAGKGPCHDARSLSASRLNRR